MVCILTVRNRLDSSTEQYLEIVDCTAQKPTMRRVVEVTNVYNPHKYTNPRNNLNLHQIISNSLHSIILKRYQLMFAKKKEFHVCQLINKPKLDQAFRELFSSTQHINFKTYGRGKIFCFFPFLDKYGMELSFAIPFYKHGVT
jgi:hypothetical protein